MGRPVLAGMSMVAGFAVGCQPWTAVLGSQLAGDLLPGRRDAIPNRLWQVTLVTTDQGTEGPFPALLTDAKVHVLAANLG